MMEHSSTYIHIRPRTADNFILYTLLGWLAISFVALCAFANFTWNDSPSQRIGIYRYTNEPIKAGALVKLFGPMKKVAALPGAHVRFAPEGIYVDNKLAPNSAPEFGLPHYPFGSHIVPPAMFLALGDHPDSWDSRYLGFLPLSLIASTVKPVWTK